jgi:hypothetical protein
MTRKPTALPRNCGNHGGVIGCETEADRAEWERHLAEQRAAGKRVADLNPDRNLRPPQARSLGVTSTRTETNTNALEQTLARSPLGRRLLDLLAEAARCRTLESLAAETANGARVELERLRRELCGGVGGTARELVARRIPEATREWERWERARADYRHQREQLEYALRETFEALPGC